MAEDLLKVPAVSQRSNSLRNQKLSGSEELGSLLGLTRFCFGGAGPDWLSEGSVGLLRLTVVKQ